MKQRHLELTALLISAGGLCPLALAAEPVGQLAVSDGPVQRIAHIYYNLARGEQVITLLGDGQTAAADTGSSESIWSTNAPYPCSGTPGGYTTSFFFGLDNPGTTSLSTAVGLLDFGDIEKDSVVDCLHINWVVAHPDTDSDSDGIGDGVVGLGGQWTVFDADNGRTINRSTRLPLISFVFFDLPGNVAPPGLFSGYSADIDLVGFGTATDLSFEIGDSDGDCQDAAFCNNDVDTDGDGVGDGVSVSNADRDFDSLPDSDLDGDGLFDWSWSVRFFQPGTTDFDGDGSPDGIPAPTDSDTIGVSFGFPVGGDLNSNGEVVINGSIPNAGTGAVDRAVLFDSSGEYAMGFNFGGFQCADDTQPFIPAAIFAFELFGPGAGPACPADLNSDGVVNFFDISIFIGNSGQFPQCDYNGDGNCDFFDVSDFIQDVQSCGAGPG